MKYNFNDFVNALKAYMEFRVEWDDEQFNKAYIEFKGWLEHLNSDWISRRGPHTLYTDFIIDYYSEANPDTHDYWIGKY